MVLEFRDSEGSNTLPVTTEPPFQKAKILSEQTAKMVTDYCKRREEQKQDALRTGRTKIQKANRKPGWKQIQTHAKRDAKRT